MGLDDDIKKLINKITALHVDLSEIDIPRLTNKITALHVDGVSPLLESTESLQGRIAEILMAISDMKTYVETLGGLIPERSTLESALTEMVSKATYEWNLWNDPNHVDFINMNVGGKTHEERTKRRLQICKDWYPFIDYSKPTATGILPHMTIKIRMFLKKIFESEGFPIAFARDLHFSMFIGYQTVMGFTGHKTQTLELWMNDPSKRWRTIMVGWKGLEIENQLWQLAGSLGIPFSSTFITLMRILIFNETTREYEIFSNLAYRSMINDVVILANWDKVREVLNKYGY